MRATILALLLLSLPFLSDAWGREGHHIVAEMAMQYMKPATKEKVTGLLGTTTPEDAATWMDDMRSNHDYDYMKPWHYIDFPKDTPFPFKTEEDAVTEIMAAYLDLKHLKTMSPEQAKVALMVLFHLVGDLHQPLHTGYAEDKGGNTVQVQYEGKGTNLHALWDEGIIAHYGINLAAVNAKYAPMADLVTNEVNVVAWMLGSRAYLPGVYNFTTPVIDKPYADQAAQVIGSQLGIAGARLAAMLDDALGGDARPEATNIPSAKIQAQAVLPAKPIPSGTISAEDAVKHIGEQLTVCGRVYGGKYLGGVDRV